MGIYYILWGILISLVILFVQIVPDLAKRAPSSLAVILLTCFSSFCFKTLIFWHPKVFSAHFVLSLLSHGVTISPKNLGSFFGEWYSDTQIWAWVHSLLGVSPFLSVWLC